MAVILVPTDFADIATAIANAANNDTIRLEQSGSPFQGANNRNNDIGALDPLTVEGETGTATDIVIDCQSAANTRGWLFDNGESNNVILKDLRITNGSQAAANGGGILIDDSSPILRNLVVDHCSANGVGGILAGGTAPLGSTVDTYFYDLVVEDNTSTLSVGGMMFWKYARVEMFDSIVRNNTAGTYAGGVWSHDYNETRLRNCQIYGNLASGTTGGGLRFTGHALAYHYNCLVYDNEATTDGGGVYAQADDTTVYFYNSTIANNVAGGDGGGIKTEIGDPVNVYLDNCIIWGNTAPNPGHSLDEAALSGVIDLDYCCYENGLNDNVGNVVADANSFTTDPVFVAGPLGNYYLSQIAAGEPFDTPCLDAGSNTAAHFGLDTRTTRSDDVTDAGIVDTGYHYVVTAPPPLGTSTSGGRVPQELRWKPSHDILDIGSLQADSESAFGARLDLRKKIAVSITVKAAFHASGTGDLVIYIRASEDDDDAAGSYDTVDFAVLRLAVDPGETAQKTITISAAPRFLKAFAVNEDATYAITDILVTAAPLGAEELRDEEMVHYNWN